MKWIHFDAHFTVIRIRGLLFNFHRNALKRNLGAAFGEERDVKVVVVVSVSHSRDLRHQSGHIRRATGSSEPRSSPCRSVIERVLAVRSEGIHIEETIPFQIDRCKDVVEKCNFGDIQILRVFTQQKHAVIEQHITHRRTCFIERICVGQFILRTEAFNSVNGPQTAGDVHSGIGDVSPYVVQRLAVPIISSQCSDVGHR